MLLHTALQWVSRTEIRVYDVIISLTASQITGVSVICWTVVSGADQRKHQSSPSVAFVRGSHRWPVNSPHKRPVTRKMFPFDYVIMTCFCLPDDPCSSNPCAANEQCHVYYQHDGYYCHCATGQVEADCSRSMALNFLVCKTVRW